MEDFNKVSYHQFYSLVSSLITDLFVIVLCMSISKVTPPLVSPLLTLGVAAFLYARLSQHRHRHQACTRTDYAIFMVVLVYSFFTITINLLHVWGVIHLENEILFLNHPFIPSLVMMPIGFVVLLIIKLRGTRLRLCINCRLSNGTLWERGRLGMIVRHESKLQINNLLFVFGITGVIVWVYYQRFYYNMNQTDRDWFVFTWLTVIIFLLDIAYFLTRYYNLYLDLKEYDEIVEPDQKDAIGAKTYMRYYVICGDSVWIDKNSVPLAEPNRTCSDTPFVTKRLKAEVTPGEVEEYIEDATGVKDGELRFYYGRKLEDFPNRNLLRFFYFLPGEPSDYPSLGKDGEWVDSGRVKNVYANAPGTLSRFALTDLARVATILLTSKTYHENGKRRSRLRSYRPSFRLSDIRPSHLDFQDDKWVKVATFNADTPFFGLRKFLHRLWRTGSKPNKSDEE